MPLQKRVTEPVHICRGTLPEDSPNGQTHTLRRTVPNELECVTNGTLANVIRQLSGLSKHAEDLFGELYCDTVNLVQRTNSLQGRIDRLAVKVTQLDSNVEEVSLQDIHLRKAFKSTTFFEQQVVSRESIPAAMLETYNQCDHPPPLDKLNAYRDDGKNGLKFYTDPNYFFELWRQEMLKDTERMEKIMQDKGRNRPHRPKTDGKGSHRKVRQPQNTREEQIKRMANREFIGQRYGNAQQGQMRMDEHQWPNHYDPSQQAPLRPNSLELNSAIYGTQQIYGQTVISPAGHYHPQQVQPNHIEQPPYTQYQPPPPYTAVSESNHHQNTISRKGSQGGSTSRPVHPPPAPPAGSGSSTPVLGSSQSGTPVRQGHNRESLPPPPPPPNDNLANGPIPAHVLQKVGSVASRPSTPGSPTSLNATPTHNHQMAYNQMAGGGEMHEQGTPDSMDLPPPPPTPDKDFPAKIPSEDMPSPPPPSTGSTGSTPPVGAAPAPPPPPPPPPLPSLSNGPVLANGDVGKSKGQVVPSMAEAMAANSPKVSSSGESRQRMHAQLPHIPDARSDLLAAIREGIKLRKVEDNKQKEVDKHTAPHDVASILARRVAMEFSDSDTEEESEYDSEAWDDDGST